MKIKRYFAPDLKQALKKVRLEQGPDAVILSNHPVNGGVELVSAIDYDESIFDDKVDFSKDDRSKDIGFSEDRQKDEKRVTASALKEKLHGKPQSERASPLKVQWEQDPVLTEMRNEMGQIRGLLENQLNGLAWSEMDRNFPQGSEVIKKMMKLGVSYPVCQKIYQNLVIDQHPEKLWNQALSIFSGLLPLPERDLMDLGGKVAVVGPTGVGKTTTIAKLAARYALKYGSRNVALVTVDNFRVGAFDQLRTYARLLDIPVKSAESSEELDKVLEDLYDRRFVLIDTAGMGQHDHHLDSQMSILDSDRFTIDKYLALSATTQTSCYEDIIGSYEKFELAGCILTKLDESTCLGGALSSVISHNLAINYVSDGQKVPEDLHQARPHSLVEYCVNITKASELLMSDDISSLPFIRAVANAHI